MLFLLQFHGTEGLDLRLFGEYNFQVADDETLVLRRKFFFSDTNVDCRDPVQLNLLYEQCKMGVLQGNHPVTRDMACNLAALQCQIQYGDLQEHRQRANFLE